MSQEKAAEALTNALADIARNTAKEQVTAAAEMISSQQLIITLLIDQLVSKGLLDRAELSAALSQSVEGLTRKTAASRTPFDQLIALLTPPKIQ